ncbi:MAG: dephospho-CoA kinase [Rhodobacteraceae bacterium]|nr:dephospho-CoA kinase [Paracoccaceae bacterium]MBR27637.1 dephospho-CoA kinase [Paracoccaceae bacterium]|tara:strand:- start:349 stop:954 length:606 start_codon:yes stop_codon:yes gene_type:complete
MILIGLTGSIGMGKSTTSAMFSEAGVPVWDADAAVARLYGPGGAAVEKIAALLPDCVTGEGAARAVDRAALRAAATSDPAVIPALEKIAHPLVGEDRETFIADAKARGCDMAVCDVPLLYETGGETRYDAVVVVSAPAEVQRERVMARPGMTEATFRTILAKQTPDAEKRARADHIVDTSQGIEAARAQVQAIIADLRGTA